MLSGPRNPCWDGMASLGWKAIGLGNERDGKCCRALKALGSKSIGMGNRSWDGKALGWEVWNGVGTIPWGRKCLEKSSKRGPRSLGRDLFG